MSSDNERSVVLPMRLRDWLVEREQNCLRIAATIDGPPQPGGWLEDATFYRAAIAEVDRASTASSATSPQEAVGPAVAVDWTRIADGVEEQFGYWRQPIGDDDGEHFGLYDLMDKEDRESLVDHICGWLVHDAPKLGVLSPAATFASSAGETPAAGEVVLPELPASQPYVLAWMQDHSSLEPAAAVYFVEEDMREYARAAVLADRESRDAGAEG